MKNKITFLTLILSTNIFSSELSKYEKKAAEILHDINKIELKKQRRESLTPKAIQSLFDKYLNEHRLENLSHNQNRCLCLCKYCKDPQVTLWTNIKQHILRLKGKNNHPIIDAYITRKDFLKEHVSAYTGKQRNFKAVIN